MAWVELAEHFLATLSIGKGDERCKYSFRNLCWWGRGKSSFSLTAYAILWGPYPLLPSIYLFPVHSSHLQTPFSSLKLLVSPFIHLHHLFSHNKHIFFILTLIPEPHYFCFWESGRTSMEGKRTYYYLDQGSSNEPPWEAGGAALNTLSFPNINKRYMNKGQEPAFLARKDNADTSSAKWDSLLP